MRNFFNSHWKVIVAILLAIVLALLTVETKSDMPSLPVRLQAHAEAMAPRSQRSVPLHIETTLTQFGYTPQGRPGDGTAGAAPSIEAAVANLAPGVRPDHIFIIGAQLHQDDNNGAAAVLELAHAVKDLRPALGTEIRFVFFMENDRSAGIDGLAVPRPRAGGNFLAYIGPRASSLRVSQALASLQGDRMQLRQGLAAQAHVMGVTLSRHDEAAGRTLVLTDAGFLRYPYFRADASMDEPDDHSDYDDDDDYDYDAMARIVSGMARTLIALAGPVEA